MTVKFSKDETKHTPGPWVIWEGPNYVGGGADLCIGAGSKWLANMDHRAPRCPQILESGHPDNEQCDICSIDANGVTDEQRANAKLIAAAPDLLEALQYLLADCDRGVISLQAMLTARIAIERATTPVT